MARTQYLYEMQGGGCYGYFHGKHVYTMAGECTHYRGGEDGKYLYRMQGGQCDFYQQDKYFYEMSGGNCRWYIHPFD